MTIRGDLRPLRLRPFRVFWTGHAASCFGDAMVPLVTAFAVVSHGQGAVELGVVLAVGLICRLASTLVGGVLADRVSRLRLMACADVVRCVVQLALGLLLLGGHGSVLVLAVGNAIYGVSAGLYGPAAKGLMPSLVGKDLLRQAAALQSLTRSACMIIGPAVAGMLIPLAGAKAVYFIDAATFAVNVVVLLSLPGVGSRGTPSQSFVADLSQGWGEMVRRRWVSANLVVHALWNFGNAVFLVLGPVLTMERFGGPASWAAISAGMSIGALLGGAVALRWQPRLPLVTANLVLALSFTPLLALWFGSSMLWLVLAAASAQGCVVVLNTLWDATLQRVIPEQVLSRVASYDFLLTMMSMPVAYALIGPGTAFLGTDGTLLMGAVLMLVPPVLVILLPSVRRITSHDQQEEAPGAVKADTALADAPAA